MCTLHVRLTRLAWCCGEAAHGSYQQPVTQVLSTQRIQAGHLVHDVIDMGGHLHPCWL